MIDGDDVKGLRLLDQTSISWNSFRRVVSLACTQQNRRYYTPVGEVTSAHFFSTVWPPIEELPDEHAVAWRKRNNYFRMNGYRPHLSGPIWDDATSSWIDADPEATVMRFVRSCMPYFDTLILVGDAHRYAALGAEFARHRTRAFIVDDTNPSRREYCEQRGVPLIDLGRLLIFYSQTILTRPSRPLPVTLDYAV